MRPRRRSHYRKPLVAYILPLITSILCIVLVVLAVNTWVNYSSSTQNTVLSDKALATFTVDGQSTFIVLDGKEHRIGKDSTSQIFSGEGVATGAGTRQYVELMGKGYLRLESYSTMFMKKLSQGVELLNLGKGNAWIRFEKTQDDVKEIKVKLKNAELSLVPGAVVMVRNINGDQLIAVIEGKAQAKILNDQASILKEVLILGGQYIAFDTQTLASIESQDAGALVKNLSDEIKNSDWYSWNLVEDRKIQNYEPASVDEKSNTNAAAQTNSNTSTTTAMMPIEVSNILSGDVFTTATITVKGTLLVDGVTAVSVNGKMAELSESTKTWAVYKLPLSKDGKNSLTVKATVAGKTTTLDAFTVVRDLAIPDAPVLTSPKTTSQSVTKLTGTVEKDVVRVDVNGYNLKKFVPGSGAWQYVLSTDIDNLKPGENVYKVVAYDKGGNASKALVAVITYTGEAGNSNKNTAKPTTASGTSLSGN